VAVSRKIVVRIVIYGVALSIVGWQACNRYQRRQEADAAADAAAEKAAEKSKPVGRTITLEDGREATIVTPEEAARLYGAELPVEAADEEEEAPAEKEVRVNPGVIGADARDRMR
jgi:hypothetical protein